MSGIKKTAGQKISGPRPPFEPYYVYVLVVLLGYIFADMGLLFFRPQMLPSKSPPSKPFTGSNKSKSQIDDYYQITKRNIFNSDGEIPPTLAAEKSKFMTEGPAVLSDLPLKLMGTIVHINNSKSVASIQSRKDNKTEPYMVGHDIQGLAKITTIERRKVIFRNLQSRRLEYIEIPKDLKLDLGIANNTPVKASGNDLVQVDGQNRFTVKRADVNRLTKDLSSILKEARVVENILPGSGGRIEGFRFTWIKPGSVIEKLGFKVGDVIKSVEGEDINDPRKAIEAYQALKSASNVSLGITRGGREETFEYNVE